jgi:hypothetical protein
MHVDAVKNVNFTTNREQLHRLYITGRYAATPAAQPAPFDGR